MTYRAKLTVFGCIVPILGCLLGSVPVFAQEEAATPYKIGIVNRQAVFKDYKKAEAEYAKLEGEVKIRQDKMDTLQNEYQAEKEKYDADKVSLSDSARIDREGELNRRRLQVQSEFKRLQSEIDNLERGVVRKMQLEVDAAITEIGRDENYHLILNSDPDGGVLFFSTTIELTQRVADKLNKAYEEESASS